MAITDIGDDEAPGKERKLTRGFKDRDGNQCKITSHNVRFCTWSAIKDPSQQFELDLFKLFNSTSVPEPCVAWSGLAFGIGTAVGNSVASGKISEPAHMMKTMRDRAASILDGEWLSGTRAGPRLRYALEAWAHVVGEQGFPVDEAAIAAMRKEVLDGAVKVEDLLGVPEINAYYTAEEAKRALAEATAAKQKVSGSSGVPAHLLPKS